MLLPEGLNEVHINYLKHFIANKSNYIINDLEEKPHALKAVFGLWMKNK
jgi:hypothetical protein